MVVSESSLKTGVAGNRFSIETLGKAPSHNAEPFPSCLQVSCANALAQQPSQELEDSTAKEVRIDASAESSLSFGASLQHSYFMIWTSSSDCELQVYHCLCPMAE